MKTHIFYIAAILALLAWREPRSTARNPVWIRDTVRETVFVPREIRVTRIDTLIFRDTIFVPLPIERKVYASKDYRAVVEGFRPELTALEIYRKTPRPHRWGVGFQAGYGVSSDGLSPYLGLGVHYNLLTF